MKYRAKSDVEAQILKLLSNCIVAGVSAYELGVHPTDSAEAIQPESRLIGSCSLYSQKPLNWVFASTLAWFKATELFYSLRRFSGRRIGSKEGRIGVRDYCGYSHTLFCIGDGCKSACEQGH